MAYVVSVSRPASVKLACAGNLLSASRTSICTASANLIHVYRPDSLDVAQELECNGRITTLTAFRAPGDRIDSVFVTTDDCRYFTLQLIDGAFTTGAAGSLETPGMLVPESGPRVVVDSEQVVVYLYCGIVTVLPFYNSAKRVGKRGRDPKRTFGSSSAVRMQEVKVHDMALDDGVLAILYRDMHLVTHLKTYKVASRKGEYELRGREFEMRSLEPGTNMLCSFGVDRYVAVGETELAYCTTGNAVDVVRYPLETPTIFNSKTTLGPNVLLLGDDYGLYWRFSFEEGAVDTSRLELDNLSIPACLVSIDDALFIGSHYADSQLVSLKERRVVATKTNLGPIQDMVMRRAEGGSGLNTLIAAAGAYRDGCLRVVRYGVGMTIQAELGMPSVRGVWGVSSLSTIVVGLVGGHLILRVSEAGEIEQLAQGEETVVAAYAVGDRLVVVQKDAVVSYAGGTVESTSMSGVALARSDGDKLYIARGTSLSVHRFDNGALATLSTTTFDSEVSAIEVASDQVLVGRYGCCTLLVGDLDLKPLAQIDIDSKASPTAILLRTVGDMTTPTLFIGMDDGTLATAQYDLSERSISNVKSVNVGSVAASLYEFRTATGTNVFVVADRATVAYVTRGRLAYSSFNAADCTAFCAFENAALGSTVIVAGEDGLRIGGIDSVQKLRYRTVPVGELVRRIANGVHVLSALTMRLEVEQDTGTETQRSFLRVFDNDTFELLDSFELDTGEMCQSLTHLPVDGGEPIIVVGTSYADEESEDCRRGRILMFRLDRVSRRLEVVSSLEVPGSVYCLAITGQAEKLLAAGINSYLRVYAIGADYTLSHVRRVRSGTYLIAMKADERYILTGDLMKSVAVHRVTGAEGTAAVDEFKRDYTPLWTTAVHLEPTDDALGALAADADGNLFALQPTASSLSDDAGRLDRTSRYHVGEMINVFCGGQLVENDFVVDPAIEPQALFGTVDGGIGLVARITSALVDELMTLQSSIGRHLSPIGGLSHSTWRAPRTIKAADEPLRAVDGDLVERYLDLAQDIKERVAADVGKSVDEIESLVAHLASLH